MSSVGVLEDKSSFSRILEDNFEVLVLGLEACVLDSITDNCDRHVYNTVYSELSLEFVDDTMK